MPVINKIVLFFNLKARSGWIISFSAWRFLWGKNEHQHVSVFLEGKAR